MTKEKMIQSARDSMDGVKRELGYAIKDAKRHIDELAQINIDTDEQLEVVLNKMFRLCDSLTHGVNNCADKRSNAQAVIMALEAIE